MDLSQETDPDIPIEHPAGLSGVKERLRALFPKRGCGNPEGIQDILHTSLEVVKIRLQIVKMPTIVIPPAGNQKGGVVALQGQISVTLPDERPARFKNLQVVITDSGIVPRIHQQAWNQRGPHYRLPLGQRVANPDLKASFVLQGQTELVGGCRGNETVVDHLLVTGSGHRLPESFFNFGLAVRGAGKHRNGGKCDRDPVVAVEPGDLLDEVDLPGDVHTAGRRGDTDLPCPGRLNPHLQTSEDP